MDKQINIRIRDVGTEGWHQYDFVLHAGLDLTALCQINKDGRVNVSVVERTQVGVDSITI